MATRTHKTLIRKMAREARRAREVRDDGVFSLAPAIAFMRRQGHGREWPRRPGFPDRAEFDAALRRLLGYGLSPETPDRT